MTTTTPRPRSRLRTSFSMGGAFIFGILLCATLVHILGYYFGGREGEKPPPAPQRPAASLAMSTLDGAHWDLQSHHGKVILVNYFATWCEPCLAEMPDLLQIADEYAPRGLITVAISLDSDRPPPEGSTRIQTLQVFVESRKIPFPILLPAPESPLFRMQFPIPQTYLFDRQGRQARLILGRFNSRSLRATLNELLAEPPNEPLSEPRQ